MNCLSVFDYFVGLALKGLKVKSIPSIFLTFLYGIKLKLLIEILYEDKID